MEEEVKLLLTEDDAAAAEMYRIRLEADGYTVITAADGTAGLELATRERPDLIYLDIRLPHMDGLDVLERLRADARTHAVPVVILSNYGEEELRARGLELGAMEFLLKSEITPAGLAETAERWTQAQAQPPVST